MRCSKRVPPSLRHPAPSRRERGAALGGGTYLRMSLQNSRAVRGQPLFSRNIRCLKRARKKALRGEQQQRLEARLREKHLVPLKNGDPRSAPAPCPASISAAVQPGGPRKPSLVQYGVPQTPATFPPLFFLFKSLCASTGTANPRPAPQTGADNSGQEKQKNPQSLHPALSQPAQPRGAGDTEHARRVRGED